MQNSNEELEQQIQELVTGTIKTLREENAEFLKQMDQAHTQRGKVQREFKNASVYIGKIEGRMMEAN